MWLVMKFWYFAALQDDSLSPCLYAACPMIAGPLPEPWSSSPSLFSLNANNNDLTGARAAFLVTKRIVVIDGHVYQGQEPYTSLAKLSKMQMEVLDLRMNAGTTGTLPSSWILLRNLTELLVHSNKLTGE